MGKAAKAPMPALAPHLPAGSLSPRALRAILRTRARRMPRRLVWAPPCAQGALGGESRARSELLSRAPLRDACARAPPGGLISRAMRCASGLCPARVEVTTTRGDVRVGGAGGASEAARGVGFHARGCTAPAAARHSLLHAALAAGLTTLYALCATRLPQGHVSAYVRASDSDGSAAGNGIGWQMQHT